MFTKIQSNHIFFFTTVLNVNFGLSLVITNNHITSPYYRINGLQYICPNHQNLFSLSLFSIGATPTMSRMLALLILSFLVLPHVHLNILISTTTLNASTRYTKLNQRPKGILNNAKEYGQQEEKD